MANQGDKVTTKSGTPQQRREAERNSRTNYGGSGSGGDPANDNSNCGTRVSSSEQHAEVRPQSLKHD